MKNKLVIIAIIVGGIATFSGIIAFAGEGGVRHVNIFLPEQIKQTVAFQNIDGEVKLVGIAGIDGPPNPDLVMRAGDYEYVLTVVNQDDKPHRLFIEGIGIHSNVLEPNQKETLSMIFEEEGTYYYYDSIEEMIRLGKIQSVFVVPKDKLGGD